MGIKYVGTGLNYIAIASGKTYTGVGQGVGQLSKATVKQFKNLKVKKRLGIKEVRYQMVMKKLSWKEALTSCRSIGATLASLTNNLSVIKSTLKNSKANFSLVWLGAT